MPLPRALARFNRDYLNKLIRPFARLVPGFGVLQHRGRQSNTAYETPLTVFRGDGRVVVALTYGEDVDWLKNAMASDGSRFIMGGQRVAVGKPHLISREEGLSAVPRPVRAVLEAIGITGFVAFPILD